MDHLIPDENEVFGLVSSKSGLREFNKALDIPLRESGLNSNQIDDLLLSGKEGMTIVAGNFPVDKPTFLKSFMMNSRKKLTTEEEFISSYLPPKSLRIFHFEPEIRVDEDLCTYLEADENHIPYVTTIHASTPLMAVIRFLRTFDKGLVNVILAKNKPIRIVSLENYRPLTKDHSVSINFSDAIKSGLYPELQRIVDSNVLGPIALEYQQTIRVSTDTKKSYTTDYISVMAEIMIIDDDLRAALMTDDLDVISNHYQNEHRLSSKFKSSGIPMVQIAFNKVLEGELCASEFVKCIMKGEHSDKWPLLEKVMSDSPV